MVLMLTWFSTSLKMSTNGLQISDEEDPSGLVRWRKSGIANRGVANLRLVSTQGQALATIARS